MKEGALLNEPKRWGRAWCYQKAVLSAVGISLLVYCSTLAPDLTWAHWGADGGDFIAAAVMGRAPHPPGFPVYMALARLAMRLPFGTPAWRMNLLSAVMAAATVGLFAALVLRREKDPVVAVVSALALAFAPLLWSQALITEVYTTAAFFAVLTLFLAWTLPRENPGIFVGGLAWGLGLAAHPTLIFLAPLWWGIPRRSIPALAGGVAIALLPYALLPLWVSGPQPWGDLRTVAGWWEFVTARLYWGYAFALPLTDWPRRLLAWGALLARQFTPPGALLGLLGLGALWQQEKTLLWRTGLAFGAASLYAVGYNTTDSLVYLVVFLALPALWLAEGLAWLARQPGWGNARWGAVVLPLAALLWHWGLLDVRQDVAARQWWEAVMAQAPAEAVLVTAEDAHTFTLWYAQEVLGVRPDVTVVDRDLWAQPGYRDFIASQRGQPAISLEALAVGRALCDVTATGVTCP